MAHPDDAELWSGGTLALHAKTGDVEIVTSTSDPIRRSEAADGAQILRAHSHVFDRLDTNTVLGLLRELHPTVVITHRLDDTHPDHRDTAKITMSAVHKSFIETQCPKRLYSCDTYESVALSGPIHASHVVDISSTFDLKLRALRAHESQPLDHFVEMAKRIGAQWGARIGTAWAEAFSPLPILGRLPPQTLL